MFDLEKFKTGKYYVHLPTQELYDEAMDFLDKHGFVWGCSRENLKTNIHWEWYEEKMAIHCVDGGIKYGRKSYYESQTQLKELKINKDEKSMKLFEGENDTVESPNNEERYTKIMLENKEIYLDKNKKYGDAFAETVKKYGYISALTRMNDKFNRIEKFVIEGFEDEEESLRDSLMDLANYCYMFVMELDNE